jgi:hypothetical protein
MPPSLRPALAHWRLGPLSLAVFGFACGASPHTHGPGRDCPEHPAEPDTGDDGAGGDDGPGSAAWTGLGSSAGAFTGAFSPDGGSLGLILPLGTREVTLTADVTGGEVRFDGEVAPDNTWTTAVPLAGRRVQVTGPNGEALQLSIQRGALSAVSGLPNGAAYGAALAAHGDAVALPAARAGLGGQVALLSDGASAPGPAVDGGGYAEAFGSAVALNAHFLAVGAPGADGGEGRVALYRREEGGALTFLQSLTPPTAGERALFGYALAFQGEDASPTLLIGAPGLDPAGRAAAGGVFLFQESEGSFLRAEIWQPPGLDAGERFGASLAVDGADAVIGAPGGDAGGRVLRVSGGTPQGWLRPPQLAAGDSFGAALHLSGGELLVGAPGADFSRLGEPAPNAGRVWLFEPSGAVSVYGLDGRTRARFGSSIARAGGLIAIGAPAMDGRMGGVYVTDRTDGSGELYPSAHVAAHAGAALAFTGETLWIGSPWATDTAPLSTLR